MEHKIKPGKQTADERARRRQLIVDYIRENGDSENGVKSGKICYTLGITARSSFRDDMKKILATGIIISPKKGYYKYVGGPSAGVMGIDLNEPVLRRWVILALLYRSGMTFQDILDYFNNNCTTADQIPVHYSEATLRNDLLALKKHGFVRNTIIENTRTNSRKGGYELTEKTLGIIAESIVFRPDTDFYVYTRITQLICLMRDNDYQSAEQAIIQISSASGTSYEQTKQDLIVIQKHGMIEGFTADSSEKPSIHPAIQELIASL